MAFDILMPHLGGSIPEATLQKWHRAVGESIRKGELLYGISANGVDAAIPSPRSGTLTEILVDAGRTVPAGTLLARMGDAAQPLDETLGADETAGIRPSGTALPNAPRPSLEDRILAQSSPLVRKLAQAQGIDLRGIRGTGTMGRVTWEDLESHINRMRTGETNPPPPVLTPSAPASGRVPSEPLVLAIPPDDMEEREAALDPVVREAWTVFEVDMGHVSRLRAAHGRRFLETCGVELGFLSFLMAATSRALASHPAVNATLEDGRIAHQDAVHLGIALALDRGIAVPVVKHADQLDLCGLSGSLAHMEELAHTRQLQPEDTQGATFTITNPGLHGGLLSLPMLDGTQAAILSLGAVKKRPAVVTDAGGHDSIAIRETAFLALGFDQRLVDSATAERFMAALKHELESSFFGLE